MIDRPTGEAHPDRHLLAQDHLGEPIPGDDRPALARGSIDPVDRQGVVGHDFLEQVGDRVEDGDRVQGRLELGVDLEQAALAGEPELELRLLAADTFGVVGVDERLGGMPREDRQGRLVVGGEPVPAELGQHDQALDSIVIGDRDEEHRLGSIGPADQDPRGSAWASGTIRAWLWAATQPVRPSPIRQRSISRRTVGVPMNVPWNAIGSHTPRPWSTR